MTAIEELRNWAAAQEEQARLKREAEHDARLASFRERVVAALGQDLLDELEATFEWSSNSRGPVVNLYYRDRLYTTASVPSNGDLVRWLTETDQRVAKFEADRLAQRGEWLRTLDPENVHAQQFYPGRPDYVRDQLKQWKLLDDPELAALLAGYTRRVEEHAEQQRAQEAAKREERERERQAERAHLLEVAATALTWDELRPVSDRVTVNWDYGRDGDLADDEELVAAYHEAEERVRLHMEQREAARVAAENAAFHPFVFYRVTMGIIGVLDEEAIVETATFDTLKPEPDENTGFWQPTNRDWPIRVHNLVFVEQITVTQPEEMPRWCKRVDTEWGAIRVPPGVEFDDMSLPW